MMIARSATPFVGGVTVRSVPRRPIVVAHPQVHLASLPVAATQNGKMFADPNDTNLHWYLPDFELAADVDPSFAFVASQSGQQANGQPFNVARLTLRVNKVIPAQVSQFTKANPKAVVKEVALQNIAAVLTSLYTDQSGHQQARSFNAASMTDEGSGIFLLTFSGTILGESVLGLYQDLRVFGKAVIVVNASFQSWARVNGPVQPATVHAMFAPAASAHIIPAPPNNVHASAAAPKGIIRVIRQPVHTPDPPHPAPPAPPSIQEKSSFTATLPLGLKYNSDGYQLKYTASTTSVASHVILSASDLGNFDQSQTQFAELKALGDISLKYPTLSRAYFGVMSRTIVLIPQRYSILRKPTGCAATCTARVDTSPSSSSQCAFEFNFTIAPEISRIELDKLQTEIDGQADFKNYQLTFADFTSAKSPSSLLTSFQSTVDFVAGADPHTFSVLVTIQDGGANTPAVANANLFIVRLSAQTGTDLIGSLSLKLDDGFPDPVLATIDLNFSHTVGAPNELMAEFDDTANAIEVTNESTLDLQLQDYALVQNANLTEFPGSVNILSGAKVTLPLPATHTGLEFVPVAQLLLPSPMNTAAVAKYLTFQTVDVQQTQFVVAVDASGVDFKKVASLTIAITFPSLVSIAPWQFTLTANLLVDTNHIQIPIEDAIFTLPGTIQVTANYATPGLPATVMTLQNDFTSSPVMVLSQNQIDSQPPPPA